MQNSCSKNKQKGRLHAVEQTFKKKISQNFSPGENQSKMKPLMTVTWGVHYRREARACLLSLHMGHCIVMGEAPSVVVPQEAPRIGTFSHFKKNVLSDKAPSMPHMLESHIRDAEAADKAEGSCYMPHVMSRDSQRRRPC